MDKSTVITITINNNNNNNSNNSFLNLTIFLIIIVLMYTLLYFVENVNGICTHLFSACGSTYQHIYIVVVAFAVRI